MSAVYKDDQDDWLTVCLKYLLFVFNFLFWVSISMKAIIFLSYLHSQNPYRKRPYCDFTLQCAAQTALN